MSNESFSSFPRPIVQFGCSMSAGFVASGLSHPADTIKTWFVNILVYI